jgi:hypothetical protein
MTGIPSQITPTECGAQKQRFLISEYARTLDDRVDARVQLLRPCEVEVEQLERADLLPADGRGEVLRGAKRQRQHDVLPGRLFPRPVVW